MLRGARSSLNVVKRNAHCNPSLARLLSSAPASASGQSSATVATDYPRAAASKPSTSRSPAANRKFKGKSFSGQQNGDEQESGQQGTKRLLQPHVLSQRLSRMCQDGKLDEALEYLKTLPLDAQNTSVWNTLISQAKEQQRFRLAYQIFVEMKRRGFKPTLYTYTTLMAAFMKVESWETRTKLYDSVHKTYQYYLDFVNAVKEHNPTSPQISVAPINGYIGVLSRAGDYQRVFDVWNSMDEEGPLAPDAKTYTSLFLTCIRRAQSADKEEAQSVRERAASDARLVWRHLTKRVERGDNIVPDTIAIDAFIRCLAMGRPADHIVAFDVLRDYVGLAKPGETAPPPRVELTSNLLQDVLWLCQMAQKPRLCIHFVQQIMETKPEILDRGHMDHVLNAYGTLSSMGSITEPERALQTVEWMIEREVAHGGDWRIRPGLSTFTLVLIACWRGKDWDTAVRTFELMTGYRGEDFTDETVAKARASRKDSTPHFQKRSQGRNITPDAAATASLLRTAFETERPEAMRQCLRIVQRLGLARLLDDSAQPPEEDGSQRGRGRFAKDRVFYMHKTAQSVVEIVDQLVPKKTEESKPLGAEERVWVEMRQTARRFLVEHRENRPKSMPELEEQPLGSAQGLAAMDSAVEWDRIHREQKSAR
ncbi:hypothetical protein PYCCODRAFT_1476342 [Trametes coccinea BRFM310]|uniref:Pentacotripeptide-repeat region of PRORP domain-containing protein n=1 Tax=Trametes coccinea (strain BRFM310) TaxID=1353009 RepID=A0A1Y2IUH6_TRAC3|nr:hypothetical protein PYCCODRAFT_1476342 [Trametes coccinea BRFM310]